MKPTLCVPRRHARHPRSREGPWTRERPSFGPVRNGDALGDTSPLRMAPRSVAGTRARYSRSDLSVFLFRDHWTRASGSARRPDRVSPPEPVSRLPRFHPALPHLSKPIRRPCRIHPRNGQNRLQTFITRWDSCDVRPDPAGGGRRMSPCHRHRLPGNT